MFGWKDKKNTGLARNADLSGAMDGLLITGHAGFVAGTHVASNLGWREVEALSVGDQVLTFDHGMQKIVDIQRETLFAPEHSLPDAQCPILVPEGAMNNRNEMWLMPDQGMLVESEAAIDALGDPFAVVPARVLVGLKGIRIVSPGDQLSVTTLAFADDEVVYVEGGMLAHCPRPRCILTERPMSQESLYDVLDVRRARFLVDCLIDENDASPLLCDPEELVGMATKKRARPTRPLMM